MQSRIIRRAAVATLACLLLASLAAYADTVPADGDAVAPGVQSLITLPDAAPGQVVTWPVSFKLLCAGLSHADVGSTIQIALDSVSVPLDGAATATDTSIGPVPDTWISAGQGCPFPLPSLPANGPSTVTLTMPSTAGVADQFTLIWAKTGSAGITGTSAITFQVNVVGNTPPTLHLPGDIVAEATSPAGADVNWTATATDNEDTTPPTPTCAPASGSTFPLGATTVHCTVTDSGGLKDSGSFLVTVADTTAPKLVGMPADKNLTTGDPSGATLSYKPPTATDGADPSPSVSCTPSSGSHVAVGTTTVTCTATDATGNHASDSFKVTVTYVSPVVWSAIWGEPVATSGATFTANPGRTVPVKVQLFADGVEQTHGTAVLTVTSCTGAAATTVTLSWSGGRWVGNLDTSTIGGPGCYVATASLDGNVAGSFRIDLRGDSAAAANGPKSKVKP
jgi:hypothetical protein